MSTATADLYYDPYDFEIDADPYPVWKRMRDEQPLYYNEKHDFWAVTRWDDVEAAAQGSRPADLQPRHDPRAHQGEHRRCRPAW